MTQLSLAIDAGDPTPQREPFARSDRSTAAQLWRCDRKLATLTPGTAEWRSWRDERDWVAAGQPVCRGCLLAANKVGEVWKARCQCGEPLLRVTR